MANKKVKAHWRESWALIETKAPTNTCNYYISNFGRVKRIIKATEEEELLKLVPFKQNPGFFILNLKLKDGVRQGFYVHKLVATYFVENDDDSKTFVLHKDMDRANNHWKNIYWADRKGLIEWQTKKGVFKPENRKKPKHVKLTVSKVKLIKRRLKSGRTKRKIIAKQFNVSVTQLKRIERGENWGHVQI